MSIAAAGQPQFINVKLETRALSGGLDAAVRSAAGWVGYAVPGSGGQRQSCPMTLEGWNEGSHWDDVASRETAILVRVENGAPEKFRTASTECTIDAGGRPVLWLTGVTPAESVRWLSTLVDDGGSHRIDGALMAVAQHAGSEADAALDAFTTPSRSERLREKASFWIGVSRGERGVTTLERMMRDDPSSHVREKVTFALSLNKAPRALELLLSAARNDRDPRVRGQALFWLGQKAGKKAATTLGDAAQNDPDTSVKKRAVFAISQLPDGEGVPRLIELARSNRNPEVRKQAMFWLGQSKDPRALDFFEEVLKH
jgi:hypothetical protein